MKRKRAGQFDLEHWRAQAVLDCYATAEKEVGNAADTYPEVARHLRECGTCRAALADILSTTQTSTLKRRVAIDDLPFLRLLREVWQKPFSKKSRVVITIPLKQASLSSEDPVSYRALADRNAVSTTGIPLYLDSVSVASQEFVLLVTMYPGRVPTHFRLVGEISADEDAAPGLVATLHVGQSAHSATLFRGRFLFDDVIIDRGDSHLELTVENS